MTLTPFTRPASSPVRSWPALFEPLWARYQANREVSRNTPYAAESAHFARRSLQNIALSHLMLTGKPQVLAAALEQYEACDNMTERLTALAVLVNSPFEAEKAEALQRPCRALQGQRPGHGPVVQRAGYLHSAGRPGPRAGADAASGLHR